MERFIKNSILSYHCPEGKNIVVIDGRDRSYYFPRFKVLVLVGHSPGLSVSVISQSSLNHVKSQTNCITCFELLTIFLAT